jgi:hypothetical protein
MFMTLFDAAAQKNVEAHRVGELGAAPEAAVMGVEPAEELARRALEQIGTEPRGPGFGRSQFADARERLGDLLRASFDLPAARLVDVGNGSEHRRKAGDAVAIARWKIGAREKRPLIGRQKHGQRPAPRAAHELDHQLVDVIQIGALFAVDLDGYEFVVHLAGDAGVLERLALHDVAPVTSRIADGQENGLVSGLGFAERLFAPGEPIDGVICVLLQIGRRFARQSIFRSLGHGAA